MDLAALIFKSSDPPQFSVDRRIYTDKVVFENELSKIFEGTWKNSYLNTQNN